MSSICITIPKKIKWEDYEKELKQVEDGTYEMNYKLPTLPKDVHAGDKCYICHDGYIKGWMLISHVGKRKGFDCATTGRNWSDGYYVSRTGKFHYLQNPIPMKGFMGYRKIDDNHLCDMNKDKIILFPAIPLDEAAMSEQTPLMDTDSVGFIYGHTKHSDVRM